MQRELIVIFLAAVILSGCGSGNAGHEVLGVTTVAPDEAYALIQTNKGHADFVVLDVRDRQEFAGGHVANAANVPFSANYREGLRKLEQNKTYLVYCKIGKRSREAVKIMAELHFPKLYQMSGGFDRWKAQGLPVDRSR